MAKKSRPLIWGVFGLVLLSILAAVIIGAVIQHIRYKLDQLHATVPERTSIVVINAPGEGQQGQFLSIETSAFGHFPLLSMELWINGVLEGVHAAPHDGISYLNTEFIWIPEQPGAYSLIARAVNDRDKITTSTPTLIFILPAEEYDGVGDDPGSPAVFPAADTSVASLQPPLPTDAVGPAAAWQGSVSQWLTNLTANHAPKAPALIAQSLGCGVLLTFNDLSDNEEGFAIYRQAPASPSWQQIAKLGSQSQHEWLTFTDSGIPGGTTYYVTAFNSQGEAASNLALVNIDPADCLAEVGGLPSLTIEFTQLIPNLPVDQVYCYNSLDGENWSRWPKTGFISTGEGALEIQESLESILLTDLDGQPVIQNIDLMMECWGWAGAELQFLGQFSERIALDGPGSLNIPTEGFTIDINLEIANLLDQPVMYPLGGEDDDVFMDLQIYEDILKYYKLINAQMGQVYAYPTLHLDECTGHLGAPWMSKLQKLAHCAPYPGFDTGAQGVNPQPYLVWFPEGKCLAGKDCLTYEELQGMAYKAGGNVGFSITDSSSAGFYTWNVDIPQATSFVIPPLKCEGTRTFWVQMWFRMYGNTFWGPLSQPAELDCFEKLEKTELQVTFETLHIGHADDNDIGEEDLEIFGYFFAKSSVDFEYLVRGEFSDWHENCSHEGPGGFSTGGTKGLGCTEIVSNGSYDSTAKRVLDPPQNSKSLI